MDSSNQNELNYSDEALELIIESESDLVIEDENSHANNKEDCVVKKRVGRPRKRTHASTSRPSDQTQVEKLEKNRTAAKATRAKRKCYVKALEARASILEKQNQTLIEQLKILKQNYLLLKAEMEK